jgi:hypothetical protein
MNNIKLLISSLLIVCSFYAGYLFATTKENTELTNLKKEKYFVNLELKSKSLSITSSSEKVQIFVNGETFSSGSISLAK